MNPYALLGAGVLAIALTVGGYTFGHRHGVDEQKVADQREFDKINQERAAQTAEANALYIKAQADIVTVLAERDAAKRELEVQRAKNRKATADNFDKYSGVGLRFRADQGAALGPNGGGACGPKGDPARADAAPVVQLPGALAANLRRLARDADTLRDEYATCYGYAYPGALN